MNPHFHPRPEENLAKLQSCLVSAGSRLCLFGETAQSIQNFPSSSGFFSLDGNWGSSGVVGVEVWTA